MMFRLICAELFKIYHRPRTYIAFAAIIAMVALIELGLKTDGKEYADFLMSTLNASFDIQGNLVNGYFVCTVVMQLLIVHIPLLICLIAADMVSGDAANGSLRLLMTMPAGRTQLLLAKFIAASFYTLSILLVFALMALPVSLMLFGKDDLVFMRNTYAVQIAASDLSWRFAGAFLFSLVGMLTITALAFFLSVFSQNSIGPIVATLSIIIAFTLLSTMSLPLFRHVKPFLFTTYIDNWREFFDLKTDAIGQAVNGTLSNPGKIWTSFAVLMVHIVILVSGSVYIFNKKDILC